MKSIRIVVLVVAIGLGLIATYFGRVIIDRSTAVTASAPQARIVVAAGAMNFGAVLTDETLVEMPWPVETIPEGAFTSKTDLLKDGRRVVLTPLLKNEPILASKVTGPNGRSSLSSLLEPGMRAVTIRVDDVRGVAGFVRPSDRVDVILQQGSNGALVADVLLKNIKVLAVDQIANERQESPVVAKAVTIEVNTEQAQKLVLAQGVGSLSLILRQPDGEAENGTRRVTLADLATGGSGDVEQKDRIATLEGEIEQMRAKMGQAGEQERKDLLNRIAQLEARMTSELRRVSEHSIDKDTEQKPVVAGNTLIVRVTRGGRPEEYSVTRENAGTLVRSGQ